MVRLELTPWEFAEMMETLLNAYKNEEIPDIPPWETSRMNEREKKLLLRKGLMTKMLHKCEECLFATTIMEVIDNE